MLEKLHDVIPSTEVGNLRPLRRCIRRHHDHDRHGLPAGEEPSARHSQVEQDDISPHHHDGKHRDVDGSYRSSGCRPGTLA